MASAAVALEELDFADRKHRLELPKDEELDGIPEPKLSTGALKAGARFVSSQCEREYKEFVLCDKEEQDPRKCLRENRAAQFCAADTYMALVDRCPDSLSRLTTCVEWSRFGKQWVRFCRRDMQRFDMCVQRELGWTRPLIRELYQPTILRDVARPKPAYHEPPGLSQPHVPAPPDRDVHPDAKSIERRPFGSLSRLDGWKGADTVYSPSQPKNPDPFGFRKEKRDNPG